MKSRALLVLMGLWLFLSCTSTGKGSAIDLPNGNKIRLLETEQCDSKTQEVLDGYTARIAIYNRMQIPLLAYAGADAYALYVGIPLGVSGIKRFVEETDKYGAFETDSATFAYRTRNDEETGLQLAEYIFRVDKNMYYLLAETASGEIREKLFTSQALAKRIEKHEKK